MFPNILALHIPDGFLNIPISALGWLLFLIPLAYALKQSRKQLGERQIPLMGILAAFVFAAQMLNFPVAGGTSGHLLGATLVAIFLGPWAMVVVMTCVIGVQALLFQDGGLLALGFNIFNMGIVSGFVGYAVYSWITGMLSKSATSQLIGAGVGAWLGVVAAAIATSFELAFSGTSPINVALPAMVGVHVLIGIGEALITVAAVAFVRQTRPDLIDSTLHTASSGTRFIAVGLLMALALAFVSPLADANPDGLERVAEDQGFLDEAQEQERGLSRTSFVGATRSNFSCRCPGRGGASPLRVLHVPHSPRNHPIQFCRTTRFLSSRVKSSRPSQQASSASWSSVESVLASRGYPAETRPTD